MKRFQSKCNWRTQNEEPHYVYPLKRIELKELRGRFAKDPEKSPD